MISTNTNSNSNVSQLGSDQLSSKGYVFSNLSRSENNQVINQTKKSIIYYN